MHMTIFLSKITDGNMLEIQFSVMLFSYFLEYMLKTPWSSVRIFPANSQGYLTKQLKGESRQFFKGQDHSLLSSLPTLAPTIPNLPIALL
jgi:hypothetical protein